MKGWIKLERKIVDHWLWGAEPFSRAQAWVDLLVHANHKPNAVTIKGRLIELEPGEQARSEVSLCGRWQWSRGKVRRFLAQLKSQGMVEQRSERHTSVIKICNFTKYQFLDRPSGVTDVTAGGTKAEQHSEQHAVHRGRTKESKNDKNTDSESTRSASSKDVLAKKYIFNPEHYRLAECLQKSVNQRFPSQAINAEQWADCVRKLIDIDGYSIEQIQRLWRWVVNHDTGTFSWAENCRSPMKLREKKDGLSYFEIILRQMRREHGTLQVRSTFDQMTDRSWAQGIVEDDVDLQSDSRLLSSDKGGGD